MKKHVTMDEKIQRINELYHKSKAEGLTPEEKEEQARLRRAYIDAIKNNLRGTLDNTKILNPDGSVIEVKSRHEARMRKKGH